MRTASQIFSGMLTGLNNKRQLQNAPAHRALAMGKGYVLSVVMIKFFGKKMTNNKTAEKNTFLTAADKEILKKRVQDDFLRKIYTFSYNRLGNLPDSQDLSHEIVLEIFRAIEKNPLIENFSAWFWSIARYTFFHWITRRKIDSRIVYLGNSLPELAGELCDDKEKEERLNFIRREISFLSKRHKHVINGHYLDSKSCETLADELNLSIGSVKRLLFEGRNVIKSRVSESLEFGKPSC